MNINNLKTIEQLVSFLQGAQSVAFCINEDKKVVYQAIQSLLFKFTYFRLNKRHKRVYHTNAVDEVI